MSDPTSSSPAAANSPAKPNLVLGAVGALAGGVLGWFAFIWIARQGIYMLALPGALLGAGAGWLVRVRSVPFAVACGVAALSLGTIVEWHFRPFIKDGGLGYFLAHLHQLQPVTLLFIGLGACCGFWFPFRTR